MNGIKIKACVVVSIFLTSLFAYSQQTYNSQHSNIHPDKILGNPTEQRRTDSFVGCIKYSISHNVVPTDDNERMNDAQFAADENIRSDGDERTVCYNTNGDWVHIYGNAELVDRIWYFADSNEEYTFFKNGILKFTENDVPEPEGLTGLAIKTFTKTDERKKILGLDTFKVSVERESGILYHYWISEALDINPASYQNNKFAYADTLYARLGGISLREEVHISEFLITVRKVIDIRKGEPNKELFKLPAVNLYHW